MPQTPEAHWSFDEHGPTPSEEPVPVPVVDAPVLPPVPEDVPPLVASYPVDFVMPVVVDNQQPDAASIIAAIAKDFIGATLPQEGARDP